MYPGILLSSMGFSDAQILMEQIASESRHYQAMAALTQSQRILYEARTQAYENARKRVGNMNNRQILEALYRGDKDKARLSNRELLEAIYLNSFV